MLNFGSDFDLLEVLKERAPLVVDGAPDFFLKKFSTQSEAPAFGINLTQAELLSKLHSSYLRAGADILRSNTADANSLFLQTLELQDRTEAINNTGMALLRQAVKKEAVVAGQISGITLDAPSSLKEEAYAIQCVYLSDTYADLIWLSEFQNANEINLALKGIRQVTQTQTVVHLRANAEQSPDEITDSLIEVMSNGANYFGLQASPNQPNLLELVEKIIAQCGIVSVMLDDVPDSEVPTHEFEECAKKLLSAEVAIIGGGKNTTFQHSQLLSKLALA